MQQPGRFLALKITFLRPSRAPPKLLPANTAESFSTGAHFMKDRIKPELSMTKKNSLRYSMKKLAAAAGPTGRRLSKGLWVLALASSNAHSAAPLPKGPLAENLTGQPKSALPSFQEFAALLGLHGLELRGFGQSGNRGTLEVDAQSGKLIHQVGARASTNGWATYCVAWQSCPSGDVISVSVSSTGLSCRAVDQQATGGGILVYAYDRYGRRWSEASDHCKGRQLQAPGPSPRFHYNRGYEHGYEDGVRDTYEYLSRQRTLHRSR